VISALLLPEVVPYDHDIQNIASAMLLLSLMIERRRHTAEEYKKCTTYPPSLDFHFFQSKLMILSVFQTPLSDFETETHQSRNSIAEITPFNLMNEAYPGATSVMGVWTLGLGLLGDRECLSHLRS
jgi:hypothetical protein